MERKRKESQRPEFKALHYLSLKAILQVAGVNITDIDKIKE